MRWWPARRVRTPTILQMETAECGATALAIVLAHYGRRVPLEEVRHACNVTRDGTSARNILEAARAYGLQASGLKKEINELAGLRLPLIAFWELKHFVVIEGIGKRYFHINDPACGPVRVDAAQFGRSFTGIVLKLEPGPEFRKGKAGSGVIRALLSRAGGAIPALVFVTLASLALVVPELLFPAYTQVFIDHFLVQQLSDWVRPLILAMVATGFVVAVITWLQQNALARLQIKLSVSGTNQFFRHLLQLPISFFLQRDSGSLATRVALNDRLAQLLAVQLGATACKLIVIVFFGAVMWLYDPVLTSVSVCIASLNFIVLKWASRRQIDGNRRLLRDREKTGGAAMAGLQIMETLKASGQESEFFVRWLGFEVNLLNSEQQLGTSTRLLASVPPLLLAIDVALVLCVGALRVMDGHLTIGKLVAFQAWNLFFLEPIGQLVESGGALQEAHGDISRLDDVLRVKPDSRSIEATPRTTELPGGLGAQAVFQLRLEGVTFGYSRAAPPLLHDFSLQLRPGERVAIVGPTGSGKSTVARLVAGLYRPWEGRILFDGKNVEQISPEVIKRSVAMVDQDVVLFPGTVRDNLTLWNQNISEADILAAARDACIHDEIERRSFGYDAPVAEGGVNFSGGQRQQLEIARALAMNPSILILDEATSALDAATEAAIVANLRARGCACLVVAHRLSTIRDSHEIIVLEKGLAAQRGTHAKLSAADGPYLRLLQETQPEAVLEQDAAATAHDGMSDDDDGLPMVRPFDDEQATDAALAGACRIVADAAGVNVVTIPRLRRGEGEIDAGQQIHAQVSGIAAANRFRSRRVALDRRWWRNSNGPLVGFLDEEHRPVALVPAGGGYRAVDPISGDHVELDRKLRLRLDRHAYEFSRPLPPGELTGRQLLRFSAEDCRGELIRMLWTAAAGGVLAAAVPFATGAIFDSFIPEADRHGVYQVAVLLIVVAFCAAMFRLSGSIATQRAQGKMEMAAQSGLWDRLLNLPASFFRQYAVGDLADRATAFNQMRLVLTDSLLAAMLGAIFSVIFFLILFVFSPRLAMLATLLSVISTGTTALSGWRQVRCQRALCDQTGKTGSLVLQLLTGITKLRVAGAEGRALAIWTRLFSEQQRLALEARRIVNQLLAFNAGFLMVSTAMIFLGVYLLMSEGKVPRHSDLAALSTGQFLAFIAAFGSFLATTSAASAALVNALRVLPIYERARPILRALPESDNSKAPAGTLTGRLEVANLSFRYPDQPPVLRGLSFQIEAGEFVAIVGPSGSGKSTLLRLLLGFETPEAGSIRYDGRDLSTLDIYSVRRQLGVVLQNGALFPGSIFMNIVGALPLTHEEAWEGARRAGLEEVIRQMPMGMYTQVGDGGATLSGGQRQQLMIARALVGNPRLFLLDEATSALDNLTQARVCRCLERVKATRILIAHRLSTVRNADRILVMKNGAIVQSGTYEALAAQPGLFAELAARQTI